MEAGGIQGLLLALSPAHRPRVPHSCTTATSQDTGVRTLCQLGAGVQVRADFISVPNECSQFLSIVPCQG